MKDSIIEVVDLHYEYPDGTNALQGVTLQIKSGSKIALLGSNGAGKSTLLLHLNGTLKPKSGQVRFSGETITYGKKQLDALRKEVGIVFQDPDTQLFSASVFQDISFGPMNLRLPEEAVRARVKVAMLTTEVMDFKDKPTHALSYGQKKRVSIAGVLAMTPQVIILDEPTASLDPKHATAMMQLFEDLNKQGTTLILSTHDIEAAWAFADYIFVMKSGRIYEQGTPIEIFTNKTLLAETDLEIPMVFEVYEVLRQAGLLVENEPPRTRQQLLKLIGKGSS